MQMMIPKEIREAVDKIRPWRFFDYEKGRCLRPDAPEEIIKLNEKVECWRKKHPIIMN